MPLIYFPHIAAREVFPKCRSCCVSYLVETLLELRGTSVITGRPSHDLQGPASLSPSGCPPIFLQYAWLLPPHGLPHTMPQWYEEGTLVLIPSRRPLLFTWLTFIIPRSQLKYYPPRAAFPDVHRTYVPYVICGPSTPLCYRERYRQLLSQCLFALLGSKSSERPETGSISSVTTQHQAQNRCSIYVCCR